MSLIKIANNAVIARVIEAPREVKLAISEMLSYRVEGCEHMARFKSGGWDGRSSFFDFRKGTFPAGFVHTVAAQLTKAGHKVQRIAKPLPEPLGKPLPDIDPFGYAKEYDYQPESVKRLIERGGMIAQCATGCHASGTLILMFDGTLKKVEDICVGDVLMGPDSSPRNVLGLHRGKDRMFNIIPNRGESFIVNGGHILSLEQTRLPDNRPECVFNGRWVNVSVCDYLNQSKTFKHIHKLHRSRGIDFDCEVELPIEPYLLGLLLGDGYMRSTSPSITSADIEIENYLNGYAAKNGLFITKQNKAGNAASSFSLVGYKRGCGYKSTGRGNPIGNILNDLEIGNLSSSDKFIPHIYKTASFESRRALLAGLIDSDGHLHNGGFDFVSKSSQLAEDLAFVARSLGLRAILSIKTIKAGKYSGNKYHRVSISGDISSIPVLIARKQSAMRMIEKDSCLTGFKISEIGEGDYYGFEVDEDNLYLMGDFTVTHNSGKSRIANMAVAWIGRPALFLTTRGVLMYQMKAAFEESLQYRAAHGEPHLASAKVGVLGDGEWSPRKTVTVGMVQTLAEALKEKNVEDEIQQYRSRRHTIESNKIEKFTHALNKNKALSDREWERQRLAFIEKLEQSRLSDKALREQITQKVKEHNIKREKTKKLLSFYEFIILEEAHEVGGDSYYEVLQHCTSAHYRLALTATPNMRDDEEANMRLTAVSGPVGIRVTEKYLIDLGILAKPYFKFLKIDKPEKLFRTTPWRSAYRLGITDAKPRNNLILKETLKMINYGLTTMILVQHKTHGEALNDALRKAGIRSKFIFGEHGQDERKAALKALQIGKLQVLIGSTILDVGVDVPSVGCIILAGGGKAEVALRQRIGRGMRRKKSGPNVVFIVDFQDEWNSHTKEHAKERRFIVENTPGFAENILAEGDEFDFSGFIPPKVA